MIVHRGFLCPFSAEGAASILYLLLIIAAIL
jgi:hypothetical protein